MKVLITGARRGIGLGLAEALARRGDTVTGTSRTPLPGMLALDLTDPAAPRAMAAAFGPGPLDLLVCNAGIYPDKTHDIGAGYPAAMWAETFAVNVTGVFLTVQALLPNLRAGPGKIAILSSVMGSDARAPGGSYIYRASKAAALNLGRNLAADLAADGIAVGIYHPGWVRTEMGGPGATVDVADTAAGLVARFDALSPATTGAFEDYLGRPLPF
ncbi:SDR family NAD(P)-dependent oxidoreductase [Albidovulum sp.]|uniref:SDR family NAD(P)-dependent oxidoreductase n=1 Tax=Albidovulum sp. TaxID=1872424 RepID=UPI0039B850F6